MPPARCSSKSGRPAHQSVGSSVGEPVRVLGSRPVLEMEVWADIAMLKKLAGGQVGVGSRGRTGRPRLGWEESLARSMGIEWWRITTDWRPRDLAKSIVQAPTL